MSGGLGPNMEFLPLYARHKEIVVINLHSQNLYDYAKVSKRGSFADDNGLPMDFYCFPGQVFLNRTAYSARFLSVPEPFLAEVGCVVPFRIHAAVRGNHFADHCPTPKAFSRSGYSPLGIFPCG